MTTMFQCEQDLLANLIVLTPKHARRKFRQHIFEAWEWKCAYCDKQLNEDTATIDHIVPKHKGGHNVKNNMACCCSGCNRSKGSTPLQVWYDESNRNFSDDRLVKLKQWMEQKPCSMKLPATETATPYIASDFYIGWVAS
jgi:CRISPR/Cas system Type II protein with McrA/HNH and RuvC-like nuclease domain